MIISTTDRTLYLKKLLLIILFIVAIFALSSLLSVNAQKVRPDTASPKARTILPASGDQPLLREYRGVALGMTAQEVRLLQLLGDRVRASFLRCIGQGESRLGTFLGRKRRKRAHPEDSLRRGRDAQSGRLGIQTRQIRTRWLLGFLQPHRG
jgi:hypothetical protein